MKEDERKPASISHLHRQLFLVKLQKKLTIRKPPAAPHIRKNQPSSAIANAKRSNQKFNHWSPFRGLQYNIKIIIIYLKPLPTAHLKIGGPNKHLNTKQSLTFTNELKNPLL